MAKSIFTIRSEFQGEKRSVLEISEQLVTIIKVLAREDKTFINPVYSKQGFDSVELNINDTDILNKVSNLILDTHKSDIKQNEKEESPDLNFSRDFGFRLLFDFKENKKRKFSLTAVLGGVRYQNIRVEYFTSDFEFSQNWYESVLMKLVNETNPHYAGITLNLDSFLDTLRPLNIKQPFGWVTYFSNDNEIQIPNDLEGVEYERTENGKFIILTREDFTVSKEAYEVQRDKLLAVMKEVKERVPEYSES